MSRIGSVKFNGASGREYFFGVYSIDTDFNNVRAVYAFSKRIVKDEVGFHEVLYIGETEELGTRIKNHEKWPCVNNNGANCICVHPEEEKESRIDKESDLKFNYYAPCNDH